MNTILRLQPLRVEMLSLILSPVTLMIIQRGERGKILRLGLSHFCKWTRRLGGVATSPDLFTRILKEFRQSAIPDRLTLANVEWIEGDAAVEALTEHAIAQAQRVTSYVTEPAKRILDRYQFAASGGWVAYGTTLEGGVGEVAYFKPKKPRAKLPFEPNSKTIKYETPKGCEALPILPWVDEETAAEIYQKYNVTPLEGETFWQVVWRCNLPIAITEGLKKALPLIAHGVPALAIRGITQWHKKGTNELHDVIAQFATAKRKFSIFFDEDEKIKTRSDVHQQRMKLGAALESCGCIVAMPVWDGKALGKGVDDVLFGLGADAQAWLDTLLQKAPTLKQARRGDRTNKALKIVEQLNQLTYSVERGTTGEYLPELPELQPGAIHVLSASMNSGKTTRIGQDWVRWAIDRGWNVLVLSPSTR